MFKKLQLSRACCRYTGRLFTQNHTQNISLDPEQIVAGLDKHIIGQASAKRCVAIAFRNRYRRSQLSEELQREITPANILMKGATGVGKTEIARRIASLAQAPFIKVEATRYTEVGVVGANTNQMIKDMLELAISEERARITDSFSHKIEESALTEVLALLKGQPGTHEEKLEALKIGDMDTVHVELSSDVIRRGKKPPSNPSNSGPDDDGDDDITNRFQLKLMMNLMQTTSQGPNRSRGKRLTVKDALKCYRQLFNNEMIDENEIIRNARENTEQRGIVFIDEIDKLAFSGDTSSSGSKLSSGSSHKEGVQKELLSLLEGTTVNTKHGPISTKHILFIASGAFHQCKVSDLLPELQGRLPVMVELKQLDLNDLRRILVEKKYNLIAEAVGLLAVEGVTLEVTDCGIDELARFAFALNTSKGSIGARRLTTVMQVVLEDISFIAHNLKGSTQIIDKKYVIEKMRKSQPNIEENLFKYIL
jgi:ATP-dependent HslUV protease ATP-binding subunit HslU